MTCEKIDIRMTNDAIHGIARGIILQNNMDLCYFDEAMNHFALETLDADYFDCVYVAFYQTLLSEFGDDDGILRRIYDMSTCSIANFIDFNTPEFTTACAYFHAFLNEFTLNALGEMILNGEELGETE